MSCSSQHAAKIPHGNASCGVTGYQHPWRAMRVLGMSCMYSAMVLRSAPLFKR